MAIPDPMAVKTTTPPVLNISDLTTGVVNGSGVFDVLMRSVNAHLDLQFKMGRVTGTEYSSVYIDALKQVLMLEKILLILGILIVMILQESSQYLRFIKLMKNQIVQLNLLNIKYMAILV